MSPVYPLESITCASSDLELTSITELYLIPPTFDEQVNLKTSLEFFWGLEKNGFEIETPLNKLHVRTDLAHLLNEGRCVLLPSREMQCSILDLTAKNYRQPLHERIAFTDAFPPCRFQYKLFPLASRDTLYNSGETGSYTTLDFDFKRPLMVESTVHPFFMLHFSYNIMFRKVVAADRNLQGEDYSRIFRITAIWEKEAPAEFRGVVSPVFWREHCHPCSDSGSSIGGRISVRNKRRRALSPSPADAQREYGGRRKKPKPRGHKSEGHKPEAHGTSDGKHLAHSRTYNLMSTDSGSHQLSAQNLRLFQLQMDHKKPSEPRRRRSQSPPSLISDHSSLSSVQRRRRRRKSVSLPLPPIHNDLPRLVFRWLQDSESDEPILADFDMTLNHRDRAEAVRPVDDAILYSREPPRVLAAGGCVLDPAYITSTQWAWKNYKVHL